MFRTCLAALFVTSTLAAGAGAQTPQPFPRPGAPRPATEPPPPSQPETQPGQPRQPAGDQRQAPADAAPTEGMLGAPIAPGAQFIASYDAGRGQRFYLYGVSSTFAETVTFYRTALKQRGEVLFESPATHMFEIARYRDETMAFPPSVTVKDYSAGGSPGYPTWGKGTAAHFPTIVQIVPAPAPAR